jgi:hypothetical protein
MHPRVITEHEAASEVTTTPQTHNKTNGFLAGKNSRDGSSSRPPADLSNTSSIALRVTASNFVPPPKESDKKEVMHTSSMEVEETIEPIVAGDIRGVPSPDKKRRFDLPIDEPEDNYDEDENAPEETDRDTLDPPITSGN